MTFAARWRIFVRLHFLQILWNFKGMQNFGCLVALRPFLARLWSGKDYLEAERRQGSFFNTHPYFAPICIGVTARLEEDLAAGRFDKPEMIPVLKNRMSGPLAAVGDAFFWETLRPILAGLAVFAVYYFGPETREAVWTVAILVLAYVLPIELIRWNGFDWGYRHGLGVVEILKRKDFQGSMRRIRNLGALVLGAATVLFIAGGQDFDIATVLLRTAVLLLLLAGSMKKWSPTALLYLLIAAGFVAGMAL